MGSITSNVTKQKGIYLYYTNALRKCLLRPFIILKKKVFINTKSRLWRSRREKSIVATIFIIFLGFYCLVFGLVK